MVMYCTDKNCMSLNILQLLLFRIGTKNISCVCALISLRASVCPKLKQGSWKIVAGNRNYETTQDDL